MSVDARVVDVAGAPARLLYTPGEGPPVVLLHGASGCADTFRPILPAWAGQDVYAVDLPGRGGSAGPARDRAEDVAAWLEGLADALGGARPIWVGHSFGGAVALELARRAPDRVGGLVLVSSGPRLRVAPAILEAVAAATPQAPFRLDAAFGPKTPPVTVETYARHSAGVPPETALADWRACDSFDRLSEVEAFDAPTLVVHGDADVLTPSKRQAAFAARLPDAERVELAGIGHMLPWEAPEALARAVAGFAAGRG